MRGRSAVFIIQATISMAFSLDWMGLGCMRNTNPYRLPKMLVVFLPHDDALASIHFDLETCSKLIKVGLILQARCAYLLIAPSPCHNDAVQLKKKSVGGKKKLINLLKKLTKPAAYMCSIHNVVWFPLLPVSCLSLSLLLPPASHKPLDLGYWVGTWPR